jgi:polyisoprenoid-binding protein YceI
MIRPKALLNNTVDTDPPTLTNERRMLEPAISADTLGVSRWTILSDLSSIHFTVHSFIVGNVHGQFETFSGTITIGSDGAPEIASRINTASVNTGNERRDGHLQGPEFFDTEQYPEAVFSSTSVVQLGEAYRLNGDLTINGVTKPVRLQLDFNGIAADRRYGQVSHYTASITLDRKDFGITTSSPLGLGNIIVGRKVAVTLDIEAARNN